MDQTQTDPTTPPPTPAVTPAATPAAAPERFVGIDVAKAKLDCHVEAAGPATPPERFTLDYGDGLAELARRLLAARPTLVVVEATGGYERRLAADLAAAGIPVDVVNPSRVRALAKATGTLAKNDRPDAANLAQFARVVRPRPQAAAGPEAAELDALVTRRRQLVEMATMGANRLKGPSAAGRARDSVTTVKAALDAERAALDKAIFALLKSDDAWDGKLAVLTSVPGVGATTAATLLAEMPELGTLSRRTVASLAGLAPFDHDSGTLKGRRFVRGGRTAVRAALHMATLTATRLNDPIRAMYQRLRAAKKPFKVAMVACARRLLTILNAMVKNNRHWTPQPA